MMGLYDDDDIVEMARTRDVEAIKEVLERLTLEYSKLALQYSQTRCIIIQLETRISLLEDRLR